MTHIKISYKFEKKEFGTKYSEVTPGQFFVIGNHQPCKKKDETVFVKNKDGTSSSIREAIIQSIIGNLNHDEDGAGLRGRLVTNDIVTIVDGIEISAKG